MRCFLFCFALIGTLLINCSAGIAQEDADVTIDSDLVEILDSFDKKTVKTRMPSQSCRIFWKRREPSFFSIIQILPGKNRHWAAM